MPDLGEEELLCGPGREPSQVHIWSGFGKPFKSALNVLAENVSCPDWNIATLGQQIGSPLHTWITKHLSPQTVLLRTTEANGVRIVSILDQTNLEVGLAALRWTEQTDDQIVGLLLSSEFCVEPAQRGQGIGKGLVAAELLSTGRLPTWEHDKPGYSPAGATTVAAGYRLAQSLCRNTDLHA